MRLDTNSSCRFDWSPHGKEIGLPDAIRAPTANAVEGTRGTDFLQARSVLRINDAWQTSASHAVRYVQNKSRDSDKLAFSTTQRACLPMPTLSFLCSLDRGAFSSSDTARLVAKVVRLETERLLSELAQKSYDSSFDYEVSLTKYHDHNTLTAIGNIIAAVHRYYVSEPEKRYVVTGLEAAWKQHRLPADYCAIRALTGAVRGDI